MKVRSSDIWSGLDTRDVFIRVIVALGNGLPSTDIVGIIWVLVFDHDNHILSLTNQVYHLFAL
jgi:hypothetical protein